MEIFHNKYIPESLDDFKFSYFSVNLLKNLVKKPSNMPNLILSGMKTYDLILFVRALLNDMYGKDISTLNHIESPFIQEMVKLILNIPTENIPNDI